MNKGWLTRFWIGMAGYVATLFGSIALVEYVEAFPLQVLLILSPIIPLAYALYHIFLLVRAQDELVRQINLETILAMSMIVGAVTFGWGLLEAAELVPALPSLWIAPSMIALWGILKAFIGRRYN